MKDNDAVFKEIAKTYVNNLGKKTKAENETQHITLDTDMLDEKFEEKLKVEKLLEKEKKSERKIYKFTKALVPLAACLVIVCIFAVIQGNMKGLMDLSESSMSEELALEGEVSAEIEDDSMEEEQASEELEGSGNMIPSPELPDNIGIVSQDFEGDTSIYYLNDEHSNEIVMKMRYGQVDVQEVTNAQESKINGHTVYKEDTKELKRITFERDGIIYTLMSDRDMDVLISIGESIL